MGFLSIFLGNKKKENNSIPKKAVLIKKHANTPIIQESSSEGVYGIDNISRVDELKAIQAKQVIDVRNKLYEDGKTALVLNVGEDNDANINSIIFYFRDNYKLKNSRIVLLSTPEFEKEKKSDLIKKTVSEIIPDYYNNGNAIDIIVVNPSGIEDIEEKLTDYFDRNSFINVCVNISKGTKIVALAEYEFFKENEKKYNWRWLNVFYHFLPLKSTTPELVLVYPKRVLKPIQVDVGKRSISNFFKGFGILILQQGECQFPLDKELKHLDVFTDKKNEKILKGFRELRDKLFTTRVKDKTSFFKSVMFDFNEEQYEYVADCGRVRKNIDKMDMVKACQLLKELGISRQFDYYTLCYIADGWFEELAYHVVKKYYNLDEPMVALNVRYTRKNSGLTNELDVLFVDSNNRLNIIECKNSVAPQILSEAINKKNTLEKHFGKTTVFQLWSTAKSKEAINSKVITRAKASDIKLMTLKEIKGLLEKCD